MRTERFFMKFLLLKRGIHICSKWLYKGLSQMIDFGLDGTLPTIFKRLWTPLLA